MRDKSNLKSPLPFKIFAAALLCSFLVQPYLRASGAPQILYTDITSGPNSGGENNKGAYLSVFGLNFGSTGLGSTTKVYINNVEVDNYRYLGPSKGRSDIQQITVQIGAIGNPTPGIALPIKVVVAGTSSNSNNTFIVNPGRFFFVDNVNGNDTTAVANDIAHPWRYVQTPSNGGAYGALQPGDTIVIRGKGANWTDLGNNNSFLRFSTKGGSTPTGVAGTGPLTIMAYPTETVRIVNTANYGISGVNRSAGLPYSNYSTWITISGLTIQGDGGAGPIALQVYADYWRVVNNELTAPNATTAKAGGVNGNGSYVSIFGNNIHDIAGNQQENHGVYIDGGSDISAGTVEIAYNNIYNIAGGNCIQQYNNGTNGDFYPTNNLLIHHNIVHDTTKHGINVADGSGTGFRIYNNIVFNTKFAGIRFNTTDLAGAQIYNNTFYNTNTAASPNYGSLTNDWNLGPNAIDVKNNIFWPHTGTKYNGGSNGMSAGMGTVSNNLWFGGSDATPSFDSSPKIGNPQFVSIGADFHLSASSPAIDVGSNAVSGLVSNDYSMTTRPQGTTYDVGAFEFAALDNTLPTIAITTPTANATTTVTAATLNIGGTASDNIGIAQVTWTNDRGGSGTATGTTSWTVSNIALLSGTNIITVTARDAASNAATDTITILYNPVLPPPNTPPVLISGPIAIPNPTTIGAAVTFTLVASDSDSDVLTYLWDFADGNTSAEAEPIHTFTSAGTYVVNVSLRDGRGGSTVGALTVVVSAPNGGGGIPASGDSDGDGVSNIDEIAAGTDPNDPTSSPMKSMVVMTIQGSAKFGVMGRDTIRVTGLVNGLPAEFDSKGVAVLLNVGGAIGTFALNTRGTAKSASGQFALKLKQTRNKATKSKSFVGGDAPFKAKLAKGTWSDDWADDGITGATDARNALIQMNIKLTLDGQLYGVSVDSVLNQIAEKSASFKNKK